VRGIASKVSYQESTEYFLSRPRSSQIGAWASSQSRLIASRVELEDQLASFTDKFENEPITKPKDLKL